MVRFGAAVERIATAKTLKLSLIVCFFLAGKSTPSRQIFFFKAFPSSLSTVCTVGVWRTACGTLNYFSTHGVVVDAGVSFRRADALLEPPSWKKLLIVEDEW